MQSQMTMLQGPKLYAQPHPSIFHKPRPKILMLSWEFPPHLIGGLGRHVAGLAYALTDQGSEVHVVTPHSGENQFWQSKHKNLFVHRVVEPPVQPETEIYGLAQQTNALLVETVQSLWPEIGEVDVIHAHDWLVAFAGLALQQTYQRPLVATIHATEKGRWQRGILPDDLARSIDQTERELAMAAQWVIACSDYMKTEIQHEFGLLTNKIKVIPNGINLGNRTYYAPASLAQFRAKYAAPGQPLIFSVGRLVYEKGYQVLIGAMPQVVAKFPQAKLVLAGKGPLLQDLQQQIAYFNLYENVQLAGFITDNERDMFLAVSDCAVFPSLYEPFGIVALEAMAANCPVIVSKTGGLAEVVAHDQNGIHIYPNNSDSTAWGILQVLENPQKANRYTENALDILRNEFNWASIAKATRAVYEQVIRI